MIYLAHTHHELHTRARRRGTGAATLPGPTTPRHIASSSSCSPCGAGVPQGTASSTCAVCTQLPSSRCEG